LEQEQTKKNYEAHLRRERDEQAAKQHRRRAAQEHHIIRSKESAERKERHRILLDRLRTIRPKDRLAFICEQPTLPIEAIPGNLIEPCLSTAQLLPANVRTTLLVGLAVETAGFGKRFGMHCASDRFLQKA
jgi:hypothetical protein